MEPSIFHFIWRYSRPQQIFLTAVIILYFPIQYLTLELPKIIVDDAIRAEGAPPYETGVFGMTVSVGLDQVDFLLVLCVVYLGLVLFAGGVKYFINVYRGRLGERMLRRLRYQLFQRVLRFPLRHFRRTSQGEIIPMITSEVEPLGGFVGTAFSDPIFQGGQLLIILGFIMAQDWVLGLAAITFYPLQIYLLPKLQRHVNELAKRRVRQVRRLSDHIGETVSGIREVHVHGTGALERARFSDRMARIFWIRYEIYRRKFFIKFLNNFIDKLTPFFFFSIGGYLVIQESLSVGALLAILAAYKDISAPWRELLIWYQQKEDVRVKYRQIIRQFALDDMIDEAITEPAEKATPHHAGPASHLHLENVRLVEPDGSVILNGFNVSLPLDRHTAVIGDAHSGKSELGQVLARLDQPTSGRIMLGGSDYATLPEQEFGRHVGYVDRTPYFQTGTIGANLLYGLKQRLVDEEGEDQVLGPSPSAYDEELRRRNRQESLLTGNSADNFYGNWIDLAAHGFASPDALRERIPQVLAAVELDQYVVNLGLRLVGHPPRDIDDWMDEFLEARAELWRRLDAPEYTDLVEPFDPDRYNENASVGENLLFGTILDEGLTADDLSHDPFVQNLLEESGITFDFLIIGKKLTETMIELFSDLPPGHEYFDRFSFIRHRDLPEYQAIASKAEHSFDQLTDEERQKLIALPFQLVVARHRLGFINDRIKAVILDVRRRFQNELPDYLKGKIAFFRADAYNRGVSFQDNLLFGKIAYGQAHAASRVNALLNGIVEERGLRNHVLEIGLNASVGVSGSALGALERQKLGLARVMLKDPDVLIVNEAMAGFENRLALRILQSVLAYRQKRAVVWILNIPEAATLFDEVVVMRDGALLRQGPPDTMPERLDGGAAPIERNSDEPS